MEHPDPQNTSASPSASAEPSASRSVALDAGLFAALVLPALVSVAASVTLLVDYLRPVPVFCAPGGGCDAVKQTSYAHVGGVPTPVLGVLCFLALGLLTLFRGPKVRLAQSVLATLAALVSVGLIGVQIAIGHFCPYCIASDTAAVVLLVAAWTRYARAWDLPGRRGWAFGASALFSLALVVPVLLPYVVKPKLPKAIVAELEKTPKGQVTIVDFADFECPWCRANHQELAPLLEEHKGKVRVVRKQVPLGIHLHAMNAALAALCAEKLGKGDAVAEALFSVEPPSLTPGGCEAIATSAGIDVAAFRACVADPATAAQIASDKQTFKDVGGRGLPLLFIGSERLEGARDRETLEASLGRALARLP